MNAANSVEQIRNYFQKEKFTFTPVRQKASEVSDAFGVRAWPTNYLIGPDGKVAFRAVGFDPTAFEAAVNKVVTK